LHWAAFFGDVDHQIERIYGGARVTLTYLLRRGTGSGLEAEVSGEDLAPRVQDAWRDLLADGTFLPKGGTLGYPCCHLYHQDARFQCEQEPITQESTARLKGRDQLVAATALAAGMSVTFSPYMFENCADETWQLDRFPTSAEKRKLGYQMDSARLQRALPIRASSEAEGDFGITWLERPPSSASRFAPSEQDAEGLPAAALLHSCDYCPWGYFGNESSMVDLYTFAALHIKIPPIGQRRGPAKKRSTHTPSKRPSRKRSPKDKPR
jgi:hypothetical protein